MAPPNSTTMEPQAQAEEGEDATNDQTNLSRPNSLTRSLTPSLTPSRSRSSSPIPDRTPTIGPDLYRFIVNGDIGNLLALETQNGTHSTITNWELMSTEDKNTVLHIAAEAGRDTLISGFFLSRCNGMAKKKNSNGDLPIHLAVKAGHFGALKALTTWELLSRVNNDGDTPLHIAVENNAQEMAKYLVDEYDKACYQMNWKEVCPLYLAIKAGYWDLVEYMMQKPLSGVDLLQGKSIVHAAIAAQNFGILKKILEKHGNLIESLDEGDRTPLSYAAYEGYQEMVDYLVEKFCDYAYKCDKDGSFPIHSAASGGHTKGVIKLEYTNQLLNRKRQNILHVAAANGRPEVVSYILKVQKFEKLINSKDGDGNTPLHLATKGLHPRVVYMLTQEKRVKRDMLNKDGLTALDIVVIHEGSSATFEARLTWMALRYVDAPRSSQSTRRSYAQKQKLRLEEQDDANTGKNMIITKSNEKANLDSYKDRIGTQLLVATLVATVTFAAGFTLPGGYFQSDKHIGMSVLAHKWAFQVFMICDTAAMYSSILSVVTLIWAQLDDLKLMLISLKLALLLLGFSLSMMSLAFMMGIFVVLRDILWLSYLILGMGSVFLVFVLVIFIPLYNPSYIRNSVVRFFFSGTFLLLLLVCEKIKKEYS